MIDLNLAAVVALTRSAWPQLADTAGQVVLISSAAALRGFAGGRGVSRIKGWMNSFAEVLRVEGQPHGIRILTLSPTQIDTELWVGKAPDEVRSKMMRPRGIILARRRARQF